MSERGTHFIESDLDTNWLRDWIGVGLAELEAYLAKHAAFFDFLGGAEAEPA
jgi:hypothetical protein